MDLPASKKGIYLALVTALVSGVSIFINKFAVGTFSPPLVFTAVKNTGVALLIISLLFFTRKYKLLGNLNKKEALYLLLIGIVGGAIPFYLFFTGLSMIPAINAALIHKTLVFWVAILAVPLLKERLTKLQGLAILILFGSNLFIGGFKGLQFSIGELLVLGATLLWAVENIIAKKVLKTVDPDIVTGARMGIGAVLLLGASFILAPQGLTASSALSSVQIFWLGLTMLSLLAYVMSWYRALKFAPAITVATILVGSTLITNILSAIFITGSWTLTSTLQSLVIVSGLTMFIYPAFKSFDKEKALEKAI
jgi:drug/metabolite transporter (DMT)-like permease